MAEAMPQNERIKEELGWLKVVFGLMVAIDASLVAWLAQNFDTTKPVLMSLCIVLVTGFTAVLIWLNRVVYRRLRQLEQLP